MRLKTDVKKTLETVLLDSDYYERIEYAGEWSDPQLKDQVKVRLSDFPLVTGRGIRVRVAESGVEIKIGNFDNGQLDGLGIEIMIVDDWDYDNNCRNPEREISAAIGIWKKDELDDTETEQAESTELKLRTEEQIEESNFILKSNDIAQQYNKQSQIMFLQKLNSSKEEATAFFAALEAAEAKAAEAKAVAEAQAKADSAPGDKKDDAEKDEKE